MTSKQQRLCNDDPIIISIWQGAIRHGLHTVTALAKATGLPYSRLNRHLQDSGSFTISDLATIGQALDVDLIHALDVKLNRRKSI